MDRRSFLRGLFATGVLVAINPEIALEQTLIDTVNMADDEFVAYITYTVNMYVTNPAHCVRITDIEVYD